MADRTADPARILPDMLRAAATQGGRLEAGVAIDEVGREWLIANGLGPLLWHLSPPGGLALGERGEARLHGAELTSRALTHGLLAEVREVLALLREAGVAPTLLKGLSYATRYYPAPHLRTLGDVDLLLREVEIPVAEEVLRGIGFAATDAPIPGHHHTPPLHHAEKRIWIELHRALRPPGSPAASASPLDPESVERERRSGDLSGAAVSFLSPECELALIADGWCHDLKTRFGLPGLQRPLFDAAYMLRATADLDWERVMGWARDSYLGASLAVLLTSLERHRAFHGPTDVPRRIVASQTFVRGGTLRAVHRLIDRYVLGPRLPGPIATPGSVMRTLDALLAPRPAWRNALAVPWRMVRRGHG